MAAISAPPSAASDSWQLNGARLIALDHQLLLRLLVPTAG